MPKSFKGALLSSGNNAKTIKSDKYGEYLTAILYLAPADLSGPTLCPFADKAGCKAGCLNTAGRGQMNSVQAARLRKAKLYQDNRAAFLQMLIADIAAFALFCEAQGKKPAVRLNGTSDIQWEIRHPILFELFPQVQFYDYTKIVSRVSKTLPANYSLVLSYSEASLPYRDSVVEAWLKGYASMVIVRRTKAQVAQIMAETAANPTARQTFDGDLHDLRFLEPKGSVILLSAKGKAKQDMTGFVVG